MDSNTVTTVIGFAVAIAVAVLATRQKGLSDLTSALQVEVRSLRDAAMEDRARIVVLESLGHIKDAYIDRLREHIVEQLPPPPPPFPVGI